MSASIIYVHPNSTSFNHAIFSAVLQHFKDRKKTVHVIDLYKDNFDPVLNNTDLMHYESGNSTDPLVKKYQEYLRSSNELVVISPIWWYELPAIFKGFIDKVMLVNFAYIITEHGLQGLLTNIKKTSIVTTSGGKNQYLGHYIESVLIKKTFEYIGLTNVKHFNLAQIEKLSSDQRHAFIEKLLHHLTH